MIIFNGNTWKYGDVSGSIGGGSKKKEQMYRDNIEGMKKKKKKTQKACEIDVHMHQSQDKRVTNIENDFN